MDSLLSPIWGQEFNRRDGLLVQRDNDDRSGDDQPARPGSPIGMAADMASQAPAGGDDALTDQALTGDAGHDGKTQLIGDALKSVYQRTLEEDIPDDFLDLLKQLK